MNTEIFKKKKRARVHGLPMAAVFNNKKTQAGQVGIEIEVEGNKFPKDDHPSIPTSWVYHHDGSLRGADNAEYVLRSPVKFDKVEEEIKKLWEMFDKFGSVLEESNRTSVHVHLNVQGFHLNRVCSFMALYFSVEEVLTAWCGEHRVGNMFCLRAKDAYNIVGTLKRFFQNENGFRFSDGMHYAGLNPQALQKFGSIEIRTLRGVSDPREIIDWVSILRRIYDLSAEFPDPREICEKFSGYGAMNYFDMVLGDKADLVRQGSCMDVQEIMQSLYEGIRLAQDLCYCRDWSIYNPLQIKPDPFNRDLTKKIIPQMMAADIETTATPMGEFQLASTPMNEAQLATWAQQWGSAPFENHVVPSPPYILYPEDHEHDEDEDDYDGVEDDYDGVEDDYEEDIQF